MTFDEWKKQIKWQMRRLDYGLFAEAVQNERIEENDSK